MVEEQFRRREFSIVGELLQVFGLRLNFSDVGVLQRARNEIVAECKAYIDDLRNAGRLSDHHVDPFGDMQSWEGLGFFERESREFKEIQDYLYSSIAEASKTSLPLRGLQLLELMKKDAQAFFRDLCVNNVTASPFFDVPILASIEPDVFVSEVLTLHPAAQSSVFAMFQGRYDRGQLNANLQPEKAWLANVKKEFEKRMSSLRPYASGHHPRQARWSAAKRLGSDGGLGLLVRLPIPGKKIRDFVGRVIWKAGEHVGEPGLGIDVVHLAGLDQGIDGGGTMAASI